MSTINAAMHTAPTAVTQVGPAGASQVAGGSASAGYTSQWIDCVASGGDCYILFGPNGTFTDPTTSTGWLLPEGTIQSFYVGPGSAWVRNSVSSTGTLKFYVSD